MENLFCLSALYFSLTSPVLPSVVVAVEGSLVAEGSSGDSLTSGKFVCSIEESSINSSSCNGLFVAYVLKIVVYPCSHFPCCIKNCILVSVSEILIFLNVM